MKLSSGTGKRTYREMLAEGLREAGVLVAIFGPIACAYEGHEIGSRLTSDVLVYVIMGFAIFGIGAILEAGRWTQ